MNIDSTIHLKINLKCAAGALIKGILIAIAFSTRYVTPDLGWFGEVNHLVDGLTRLQFWLNGYGPLSAFLAISAALVIYWMREVGFRSAWKRHKGLVLMSVLFGLVNVMGMCVSYTGTLPTGLGLFFTVYCLLPVIGWALAFQVAGRLLYLLLDILSGRRDLKIRWTHRTPGLLRKVWRLYRGHVFWFSFALILLGWLPWMLIYYPGSLDNDVAYQLDTVLGILPKSNHHPWLANSILVFFFRVGRRLVSENFGIFLFVATRNLAMALMYAAGIRWLDRQLSRPKISLAAACFYGFLPVWAAYSKHVFKDTLGIGLFAFFVFLAVLAVDELGRRKTSYRTVILLGLFGALASLIRNNFIFCVLPTLLVIGVILIVRQKAWRQAVVMLLCVSSFFAYSQYIYHVEKVAKSEGGEALSVFLQMEARAIIHHKDQLTEEEKNWIDNFMDPSVYEKGTYNPLLSDPIKDRIHWDRPGANAAFAKLWFALGRKYPAEYLAAFVGQSSGYYSFTPRLPVDAGNMNANLTIFGWIGADYPFHGIYDIHYLKHTELLRNILDRYARAVDQIPLISIFDQLAFYTWFYILFLGYLLKRKMWLQVIPLIPVALLVMTCMISPVNDCFRYMAGAVAAAPLVLALLRYRGKERGNQEFLSGSEEQRIAEG